MCQNEQKVMNTTANLNHQQTHVKTLCIIVRKRNVKQWTITLSL